MNDIELQKGPIIIQIAKDNDLELLMAWRSHPDVYQYFTMQDGPLTWKKHYKFWMSRQDRKDWIIYFDDGTRKRKVGSVNVSKLSSETPEIGIFIGEITLMGKGIGTKAIDLVNDWLKTLGHRQVVASVSKDNIPSQRLFKSLGFEIIGESHEGKEWMFQKLLD